VTPDEFVRQSDLETAAWIAGLIAALVLGAIAGTFGVLKKWLAR